MLTPFSAPCCLIRRRGSRRVRLLRMEVAENLAFDPSDPAFIADPYPVLNRFREGARVFYDEAWRRWFVTRHEDVRSCLRDKRLGGNFRHVMSEEEVGAPPLDPR